ncbi:MAG: ParB/RepB/Spo0J family partition protein [Chloroflexi bacterium]|nr:ParB/RepB/Spo0J family partition protein [Chloroflexota bacterium]
MSNRTMATTEIEEIIPIVTRRARRTQFSSATADDITVGQVNKIKVTLIRAGDNDRTVFTPEEIESLARDIARQGLAQPITVRPINDSIYRFEIVAGERRYRAVCALTNGEYRDDSGNPITNPTDWQTIDAIVRPMSDEQAAAIMLSENVHRKDLDPIDEANAYRKRMDKYGWTLQQTAANVNKTERHIRMMLSLLDLLPEIQEFIRKGIISIQYGAIMATLDINRQRIALKYLSSTDKPVLREFKAIVGELLSEQAQERFINPDELIQQAVAQNNAERQADLQRRSFPIDQRLPLMEPVGSSVGATFEAYIKKLLKSSDAFERDCAGVVGRVYDSLLRNGMAFSPSVSPKRKK